MIFEHQSYMVCILLSLYQDRDYSVLCGQNGVVNSYAIANVLL